MQASKASSQPFDVPYPAAPEEGGWTPISPSAIAHSDRWPTPTAMSQAEIDRVVESFAAAARRAGRIGFDVIEVHAAHGYLISSFLSPVANARTDGHGGPLANRMRFALEVATAMRAAWPADKAIGFKVNGTDCTPGGVTPEETTELARALRGCGIDFVTVSSGGNARGQTLPPLVPGYQVHIAQAIKGGSGIATMALGMILKAEQAEAIVANGQADLVGSHGRCWTTPAGHSMPRRSWAARPATRGRGGAWPGSTGRATSWCARCRKRRSSGR